VYQLFVQQSIIEKNEERSLICGSYEIAVTLDHME